jgi:hypothetical protein
MNTRIDIENELRQLQSPLAGLAPVNVFTVPEGYFEGLAPSVMRAVQGDSILQSLQRPADAQVPEGYFEGLAGSILGRIKAQETAQAGGETLSPLLQNLRSVNVFTVPQGYFEGLTGQIVGKLPLEQTEQETLSPLLQGLRTNNVFTVPEGYFEVLTNNIVDKLPAEQSEEETLSPLLQSLRANNVFTVPAGYFEQLPQQVTASLRPKAKVVSLRRRFWQYAAAAVVAGMAAVGVYKYNNGTGGSDIPPAMALTEVQRQGIALSKDEAQFNKEMEQVSSEAIIQFLTADGSDVDDVLAAAAVNESELPSEEELMLDEKALEAFFNGDGKKSSSN